MRSKGFEGMVCSVAEVMGALGDRWGVLIMRDLLLGLTKYEDLRYSTGITNATLSDRLKALESMGLIERRPYQTRPLRYEYVPTNMGRDIGLVMQAMVQVGDRWNLGKQEGRPLHFINRQTGNKVQLAAIDVETKEMVPPENITTMIGSGADELTRWRLDPQGAEKTSSN